MIKKNISLQNPTKIDNTCSIKQTHWQIIRVFEIKYRALSEYFLEKFRKMFRCSEKNLV